MGAAAAAGLSIRDSDDEHQENACESGGVPARVGMPHAHVGVSPVVQAERIQSN